jgi:DNA polymerase-3 subunit epsilon
LFADISAKVKEMFEDAIIVAHNAPFDLGFIGSEYSRLGQSFPSVEVIDTLQVARNYFNFSSNSLQAIANELMIERSGAHRAMADVLTTREVLACFFERLEQIPAESFMGFSPLPVLDPGSENFPPSLQEALASKKDLVINYVDQKGKESRRRITPIQITMMQDYIYINAYCHLRGENRSFRLDRIVEIQLMED